MCDELAMGKADPAHKRTVILLNDNISEAMAMYIRQILENLVPTRELLCRFPYQRSQNLTKQK